MGVNTQKTGVDAFITDTHHHNANKINPSPIITPPLKRNRQGLLLKKLKYRTPNNKNDCYEWRCLPIYKIRKPTPVIELITPDTKNTNFNQDLINVITKLVDKRLTKKQKLILKKISNIENKTTMSFLTVTLSKELKIGKTTARNTLQTLRDVGLIYCGNSENKGTPVKITRIGKIVIDRLNLRGEWGREIE
jgi:hypothetical protein